MYGRSRYIKQSFQKRGDYLIVCLMISKGMKQIILKVCFLLCIVFVFLYYVCVRSVKERVVETAERPVEQLQAWRQPAQQTQSELHRGRGAQRWRLPLWVALTATFLLDTISFFLSLSLFSMTGVSAVISLNFNSIIVHWLHHFANLCSLFFS